ncbi:MAG: glycerophosphodiester phosphodiesterase family protein [Deltaproteobacteria bacterium]|nr:glycerophosphodiester phosphodiesterase family protein [Deltaproteobacteria bacterium]
MPKPGIFIRCLLPALLLLLTACANGHESRRIAHAGGGYKGEDYTNSLDALDENLRKGFTLFEMDLNWTADFKLVCVHDWGRIAVLFPEMKEIPTLEEFKRLVSTKAPYRICTVDELAEWMERNPKARLVTDVKMGNIQALRIIAEKIKDFDARVIPQIYQPQEYAIVKGLGYRDIIWTLYRFNGNEADVLSWAERMDGLYAVTIPVVLARAGLGRRLQEKGIYTYTHTINDAAELEFYRDLGIDNIYTDFLPPG